MHRQRGMSFMGLVFVIAVIVAVAVIGMKLTPAYIEYVSVKKAISKIANEPGYTQMSKKEIIDEFDRSATIDDIKSVEGKDLKIEKNQLDVGVAPIVSVEYQVVVPLIANISALLDFEVTTAKTR